MTRTSKGRRRGSKSALQRARGDVRTDHALRSPGSEESLEAFRFDHHARPVLFAAAILLLGFLWSYWTALVSMEFQWRTEPDYSHGYLIVPLALVLLYSRRESFPGLKPSLSWFGLSLLLVAGAMQIAASMCYMEFLEGWSIVPWVAGAVWILAGSRALIWALPAIGFLVLMVPLPFRLETMLSWKLQGVVTAASESVLRVLGLPAIADGHTIWIGEKQMLVEEACSGLRIFVGMAAFAFFWASLTQRAWIDKVIILLAALPMAIIANTIRVVMTCCFFYWLDDVWAHRLHDWAGILMIFLAGGLLWAVKSYWELLYRPARIVMPVSKVRDSRSQLTPEV